MNKLKKLGDQLKEKWGVSFLDMILIMVVFSLAGMTVVTIKPTVLGYVLDEESATWIKWIVYIALIMPIYQLSLLIYGSIFGQFSFFWEKEKKLLQRILKLIGINKLVDRTVEKSV